MGLRGLKNGSTLSVGLVPSTGVVFANFAQAISGDAKLAGGAGHAAAIPGPHHDGDFYWCGGLYICASPDGQTVSAISRYLKLLWPACVSLSRWALMGTFESLSQVRFEACG